MNILKQYISRANEIIGERTPDEQKYDHEVTHWMRRGKSIKKAIAKANEKYRTEALQVDNDNLADLSGPLRIPGRPRRHHGETKRTQEIGGRSHLALPCLRSFKGYLHLHRGCVEQVAKSVHCGDLKLSSHSSFATKRRFGNVNAN